jgi:hypothetical protein
VGTFCSKQEAYNKSVNGRLFLHILR